MKLVMTSALTPALSPRRGGIIRRVLSNTNIAGLSYVLRPMTQNRRQQQSAKEFSSDVTLLTLSPGERARVRAGVKQNSFNFAFFCGK
jgi:hypothetical protein